MRVEYRKRSIAIIPETPQDEVYLEKVLNLYNDGDEAIAERVAPIGLPYEWAYVKIYRNDKV